MQKAKISYGLTVPALAALLSLATVVQAQVSVNEEARNACVRDEMIALTAKGAGIGAMAGLGAALLSGGKKEDALKKAAIGAAVGGATGLATGFFTANANCNKKNPDWIPESKIERTQDYEQVKKTTKYKPSEGIKAQATKLGMPSNVKAGSALNIESSFYVLTPDGAETEVMIERKLFAIVDGKETQVPFLGKESEQRTFQPGEHKDTVSLPTPPNAPAGTKYRFEFSVSAGGKPVSTVQGTFTVE